jgi:hypothetical protein
MGWSVPHVKSRLYYRAPQQSRICIWRNVRGPVLVDGSTAVFVGITGPREHELLAVKEGARCLEIGRPILELDAKRQGQSVSGFVNKYHIDRWRREAAPEGLKLEFLPTGGTSKDYRMIVVSWEDINDAMRRVETEGRPQETQSGMSYLQIDYAL